MAAIHGIRSNRGLRIGAVLVFAVLLLALLAWLALPRVQSARAGSMLEEANGHIADANASLEQLDFDLLSIEGFTSLDGITKAGQSLSGAGELIQASAADISEASAVVESASGLRLLPGWYREYLGIKLEIAGLRAQQLEIMMDASTRLEGLYGAAPLIFQSMSEMDRMLGQLEAAIAITQDDPQTASVELSDIAASMRSIQQQLDDLHQQSGFDLLENMSRNVADNAALAEAAGALADAVASGDQGRVQQQAGVLEQQLLDTTVGVDYLDLWLKTQLRPLKKDYDELQEKQVELDARAAALYEEHAGS